MGKIWQINNIPSDEIYPVLKKYADMLEIDTDGIFKGLINYSCDSDLYITYKFYIKAIETDFNFCLAKFEVHILENDINICWNTNPTIRKEAKPNTLEKILLSLIKNKKTSTALSHINRIKNIK